MVYFAFLLLVTAALDKARERLASAEALAGLNGGEEGWARERVRRVDFKEVRDLKCFNPLRVSLTETWGVARSGERGKWMKTEVYPKAARSSWPLPAERDGVNCVVVLGVSAK